MDCGTKEIDWDRPISFKAAEKEFEVTAERKQFGYVIKNWIWQFSVDKYGTPLYDLLSDDYKVFNVEDS